MSSDRLQADGGQQPGRTLRDVLPHRLYIEGRSQGRSRLNVVWGIVAAYTLTLFTILFLAYNEDRHEVEPVEQ